MMVTNKKNQSRNTFFFLPRSSQTSGETWRTLLCDVQSFWQCVSCCMQLGPCMLRSVGLKNLGHCRCCRRWGFQWKRSSVVEWTPACLGEEEMVVVGSVSWHCIDLDARKDAVSNQMDGEVRNHSWIVASGSWLVEDNLMLHWHVVTKCNDIQASQPRCMSGRA